MESSTLLDYPNIPTTTSVLTNNAAVHPHSLPAARKPAHASITTFHMPFLLSGFNIGENSSLPRWDLPSELCSSGWPLYSLRGLPLCSCMFELVIIAIWASSLQSI
ncbi:hypothetical protein N7455_004254, partial [Penicillium solitum]|uniref:uncharacterized protein n=1 Tax=Penicillium solitum TaxID=60172 RepID=UPI0032C48212